MVFDQYMSRSYIHICVESKRMFYIPSDENMIVKLD